MNNQPDKYVEQLRLYQSANTDAESVKSSFVIRIEEYKLIIETLKRKKVKSAFQHELILGRRGSGKSTLLRRIEIDIKEDQGLSKQYFPILFAEEQATIYRLSDLWYETLKELSLFLNRKLELLSFSQFNEEKKYARYLFEEITKVTKESEVYPVLLLDNFDKIITSLGENTNLLREQLLNYDCVKIIGASTRMDEHFWGYKVPFYNYFRIHNLGALSIEEIDRLFNLWSDLMGIPLLKNYVANYKGKIKAIRILTDGLPRTLQFFIRILISKDVQYGFDYIKMIMDQVTPIYQERLNNLTPPQRKIFAEMAFIWESCGTKSLVDACRMESKVISAQLNQLISYGFVEKIETGKKNHLYRISERFFNMWYIVTQGNPTQKRKARYLTLFLENWYDGRELENLATEHLNVLAEGTIPYKKAALLSIGLSQSKYIGLYMRDRLIESTMSLLDSESMADMPIKSQQILNEVNIAIDNGKFKLAISILNEIENEADGIKFDLLGICYSELGLFEEAGTVFLKAKDIGNINSKYNLAYFYQKQGELEKAEPLYIELLDNKEFDIWNNLALLYKDQNKLEEAESAFKKAIKSGSTKAMSNLPILYEDQGEMDKAEYFYLEAAMNIHDVNAMYNLALIYKNQGKLEESESYYLMAINKGHANSLTNLILDYFILNDKQKALKLINKTSIELDDKIAFVTDVWLNNFENIEARLKVIISKNDYGHVSAIIKALLCLHQKNLVFKQFNDPELGQKLQDDHIIIYYATLLLTENDEKLLELRIPEEIKETVYEFIKEVEEKIEFYNQN